MTPSPRSAPARSDSPDSVRCRADEGEVSGRPREGGALRELLSEALRARRGQGNLDQAHGSQAAEEVRDLRALVRPLRRRGRGAARHQAPVRRRSVGCGARRLHPGRRRHAHRRSRCRAGRDRGARGELGPELQRQPRALPSPAPRIPLRREAAQDQVPEPVPGRRLQRPGGRRRRANRRGGLARDDRPQLGRRTRRALGLGPGIGLRGSLPRGLLRHGGRPDQGRGSHDSLGRERDADAGRDASQARWLRARPQHRGLRGADRRPVRPAREGRQGLGQRQGAGQGLRGLDLRRPGRARAQHAELLDLRPRPARGARRGPLKT